MRQHSTAGLTMLTLLIFAATTTPGLGQQWAAKMFTEKEHDFGTVARGADVFHRFPVKNVYKQDMQLTGVRSSCGCTTPSIETKVLKSLETGYVLAKFNTRTFTGVHGATLTVSLKWTDERRVTHTGEAQLRVHGDIRGDVVFSPGAVRFDAIDQGDPASQRVRVTYAGRSSWRITDVLSKSDDLEVELLENERSSGRVRYDLLVRLKDSAPAGALREQLVLVTNDSRNHRIPLIVEGKIVPEISVAPESIVLGEVAQGTKISKRILVRGKKPFRIVDFDCPDGCFSFSAPEQVGERHIVEVVFDAADSQPGKVRQAIQIATDLGENYRAQCMIYAEVVSDETGENATTPSASVSTAAGTRVAAGN